MVDLCRSLSLARSSKETYAGHQKIFVDCCAAFGFDHLSVSEYQLSLAVAHFTLGHSVRSVPSYLSAIQHLYTAADAGPLPRGPSFQLFTRGLMRLFGSADEVVRARALDMDGLRRIIAHLDTSDPDDICFCAMLLVAFFLALRTEDAVDGRIRAGDVFPREDGATSFHLPPGKNNRLFTLVTVAKRRDSLDLIPVLRRYTSLLPPWARAADRPLFVSFEVGRDGRRHFPPVSRARFTARFKAVVVAALGDDPSLYSAYSLRRGGVTAMLAAGVPVAIIKRHVRWAPGSEAINLYYDHDGDARQRLPTQSLG